MSTKSLSEEAIQVTDLEPNEPRARLCHLKKWPDFQGYGFNLHAERAKLQQHIGKVDPNSPAESAGLKEGDRIIEVNYVNISNENHQQVVKRIRNGLELDGQLFADQVVLLVLDPEADEYYKKNNIVVRNDLPNVLRLQTPDKPVDNMEIEAEIEEEVEEVEKEEEITPELTLPNNIESDRVSKCSIRSHESEKLKSTENLPETEPIKVNSLNSSSSDLNNNRLSDQIKVDSNNNINKTSTNSTSSLTNSQDSSPLNKSKQSNNSSGTSSPVQSQNSTLNRSNNAFPKDEIFSIRAVHEILETNKTSQVFTRSDIEKRYENSKVEFRNKSMRPPRPPPPSMHSYRASTISTITQPEDLDKLLEMSAADFKQYLKSKGRNDPRVISVDMKRKYEIFQNM
ncbi:unnamed protein product [Brachionus calyciflorus]|uniref:PDZ domain-containing protein n=1 Tax=Brachionus calyciflorus TaxID=104777 RepID=A0A813TRX3_9BILA|nr:unnamed protein product [Brachionus calyciflorus]